MQSPSKFPIVKRNYNLIKRQNNNFKNLTNTFKPSTTPFRKVYTVDKQSREQFGDLIESRTCCYNCNKIGHFKSNCPKAKKFIPRAIQHLLQDDSVVFEEQLSEVESDLDSKNK